MKLNETPVPINVQEKYLYGINVRLEVLIEQMSSLLEHIAKRDSVAVTNAENVTKIPKKSSSKSKE